MWYKSQGKLKYYPYGDWWVILECCDDLVSYYRMMVERKIQDSLQKAKHGSHISVVRGEGEPENKECWFWHDGGLMDFEYQSKVSFGDNHVWLSVRSESLIDLRHKLGLSEKPEFGFHLTLGKYKDVQI